MTINRITADYTPCRLSVELAVLSARSSFNQRLFDMLEWRQFLSSLVNQQLAEIIRRDTLCQPIAF